MITYKELRKAPHQFQRLTDVSINEFEVLLQKIEPVLEQMNYARLDRPNRQRSIGGGPNFKLDLGDRLLMTVMLLHLRLNTDALGICFDVDKATVSRNTRDILPVLYRLDHKSGRWSRPPNRGQGKRIEQALREYPVLQEIIQ
jgi:hypothetical protein